MADTRYTQLPGTRFSVRAIYPGADFTSANLKLTMEFIGDFNSVPLIVLTPTILTDKQSARFSIPAPASQLVPGLYRCVVSRNYGTTNTISLGFFILRVVDADAIQSGAVATFPGADADPALDGAVAENNRLTIVHETPFGTSADPTYPPNGYTFPTAPVNTAAIATSFTLMTPTQLAVVALALAPYLGSTPPVVPPPVPTIPAGALGTGANTYLVTDTGAALIIGV